MDTVKTFVRYKGITGNDPFDDLRMLEYGEKLADAGIDFGTFFDLLVTMASVLEFAKTDKPIDQYVPNYDMKTKDGQDFGLIEATEFVMSSFATKSKDNQETKKNIPGHVKLDITDPMARKVMKYNASQKKEAVSQLLSNIIQVGASMDVVLGMEYVQAVDFINFRAKVLDEQAKKQREQQRKR